MRKSLTLMLGAPAALVVAGAAYAQPEPRGATTRAETEQRTGEMFGRMDANDDGLLNDADREAVRREAFDAIDADKDGTISPEERREARQQMRHHMRRGRPARDDG